MGLLEAIDEADIAALADENDSNSDGISGRMRLVTDAVTSETRIGRFGWKASQPSVKQQVAAALNTDVGVMTSVMPDPDCGASQTNCGPAGSELSDQHLDELTAYIALLGVSARRDLADPVALQGEALFDQHGLHRLSHGNLSDLSSFTRMPNCAIKPFTRIRTCCCTTWGPAWRQPWWKATPRALNGARRRCGISA